MMYVHSDVCTWREGVCERERTKSTRIEKGKKNLQNKRQGGHDIIIMGWQRLVGSLKT